MRRRVGVAVVVAALVAWWATRSAPTPVRQVADRVTPASPIPVAAAPVIPAPVPAPTAEPVDERRAAKEAAITVLAAASGRYAVVCPPPLEDRDGTSWKHPEEATCAMTKGIVCAASQSAGSVVIRREDNTPVVVYRWDTGADGATTCVLEPPSEGRVRLRVVDEQGEPRAGASVGTSDLSAFATTDADGGATLSITGTGTHQVFAFGDDGAVGRPAGVVAGGKATLVLGDRPADIGPGEVLPEVRLARRLEAVEDLEAALEASPPAEVARELGALLDMQERGLDLACETSDLPTCRAWNAR